MADCVLIKPDLSFESEIEAFRKEMIEANSSMDGTGPLKHMDNIKEWLKYSQCCGNKEYVPENWVTCDQYIYVRIVFLPRINVPELLKLRDRLHVC
ncbi:hypothetical protein [Clostridium thermosuccinogenes]|uniref:hypothetical protein n=1 Tax=Clostridium thermosuccinogenes TaxID=84032 RepID=UPI000CCBFC53|nr:hypothetical protein [Pseudoclostridium thermosuccinogenes]PNT92560.1 hypothetical protein CDQ83_03070 [Pseudoclostridium thermosuccinogenes]